MAIARIQGGAKLRGRVRVPADAAVTRVAITLAGLAGGTSRLAEVPKTLEPLALLRALEAMGVRSRWDDAWLELDGVGGRLRMPPGELDAGSSRWVTHALSALVSSSDFGTRVVADAGRWPRDVSAMVGALKARGAHLSATRASAHLAETPHSSPGDASPANPGDVGPGGWAQRPPISIAPRVEGEVVRPLDIESAYADEALKASVLLSGLSASGVTAFSEPTVSPDHLERMMLGLGLPVRSVGGMLLLDPSAGAAGNASPRAGLAPAWAAIPPFAYRLPRDADLAGLLAVAALGCPGSEIHLPDVLVNPTRTGLFDLLRSMRARLRVTPSGELAGLEPVAEVVALPGPLGPAEVGGELLVRAAGSLPAFLVAAAVAEGSSAVRDVRRPADPERDDLTRMVGVLKAFGVDAVEHADGATIHGARPWGGARVETGGEPQVALMASVMALLATSESRIERAEAAEDAFPGFFALLSQLGVQVALER